MVEVGAETNILKTLYVMNEHFVLRQTSTRVP